MILIGDTCLPGLSCSYILLCSQYFYFFHSLPRKLNTLVHPYSSLTYPGPEFWTRRRRSNLLVIYSCLCAFYLNFFYQNEPWNWDKIFFLFFFFFLLFDTESAGVRSEIRSGIDNEARSAEIESRNPTNRNPSVVLVCSYFRFLTSNYVTLCSLFSSVPMGLNSITSAIPRKCRILFNWQNKDICK